MYFKIHVIPGTYTTTVVTRKMSIMSYNIEIMNNTEYYGLGL